MDISWPKEIFILKPSLADPNNASHEQLLSNEYGRDEDILLLKDVVQSIEKETKVDIITTTLINYKDIFADISKKPSVVVFNLCDGTEDDGYPGLSIVKELERLDIPFTGAGSYFYETTTSKVVLKKLLVAQNVPTSRFVTIRPDHIEQDVESADQISEWPLIIKPAVSYASISITDRSIVDNKQDAIKHIKSIIHEKNGGVFIETFLAGNEFTALVTGNKDQGTKVYPVAERVFNSKLQERQKILAFDRCIFCLLDWDGFDLNGSKPTEEQVIYWYAKAKEEWQSALQDVAQRAYLACGGSGYGRVDIRFRKRDVCEPVVLEVNSNCGLSFGAMSSSLGEILNLSHVEPALFCKDLITFALARNKKE